MHMQLCLRTQRSVLGSSRSFKCGSPVVQQHKSCDFCCCHWATSLWKARPTRWLLCQLTEHHSWPHAAAEQNDVFPPHIRSHGPGPEEWYPSLRLGSSSLGISEGFPKRFSVSTRYMGQFCTEREKKADAAAGPHWQRSVFEQLQIPTAEMKWNFQLHFGVTPLCHRQVHYPVTASPPDGQRWTKAMSEALCSTKAVLINHKVGRTFLETRNSNDQMCNQVRGKHTIMTVALRSMVLVTDAGLKPNGPAHIYLHLQIWNGSFKQCQNSYQTVTVSTPWSF